MPSAGMKTRAPEPSFSTWETTPLINMQTDYTQPVSPTSSLVAFQGSVPQKSSTGAAVATVGLGVALIFAVAKGRGTQVAKKFSKSVSNSAAPPVSQPAAQVKAYQSFSTAELSKIAKGGQGVSEESAHLANSVLASRKGSLDFLNHYNGRVSADSWIGLNPALRQRLDMLQKVEGLDPKINDWITRCLNYNKFYHYNGTLC